MNYTVLRGDEAINAMMVDTSLRGYIHVTYQKLVELFGQPGEYDNYKSDTLWVVKFEDGAIASVYNYKDGPNYLGKEGTPVIRIMEWHIGGKNNSDVLRRMSELLQAPITMGR